MGEVKSAFEKAMEKAAGIGELTPKEREGLNRVTSFFLPFEGSLPLPRPRPG